MVIIRGNKSKTLDIIFNCKDISAIANFAVSSNLWNCRLGHELEGNKSASV